MTIARKRPLNDADYELIRLVALGHSNGEIAEILGISPGAVRNRLCTVQYLLSGNVEPERRSVALARLRMAVWAYRNGLMDGYAPQDPAPVQPAQQEQPAQDVGPTLPAELVIPLLALCQSIVDNRPRGDLRRYAMQALRAARALRRQGGTQPQDDAEHQRQVAS